MEAKATRLDELRLWSILEDEKEKPNKSIILVLAKVRNEQAEISFKAGREAVMDEVKVGGISVNDLVQHAKREGIKEVVEWGAGVCADKTHHPEDCMIKRYCSVCRMFKLKEWGIEEVK